MRAATAAPEPPLEPPGVRLDIPGIAADSERFRLGDGSKAELGRVGLGDEDQPCLAIADDELAVGLARNFGKAAVALAGRRPGERRAKILEQERHAGQRAGERAARRGAGAVVELVDHGVERRIARLDPGDRLFDELDRRDLAAAHQLGEPEAVEAREIRKAAHAVRLPLGGVAPTPVRGRAQNRGPHLRPSGAPKARAQTARENLPCGAKTLLCRAPAGRRTPAGQKKGMKRDIRIALDVMGGDHGPASRAQGGGDRARAAARRRVPAVRRREGDGAAAGGLSSARSASRACVIATSRSR